MLPLHMVCDKLQMPRSVEAAAELLLDACPAAAAVEDDRDDVPFHKLCRRGAAHEAMARRVLERNTAAAAGGYNIAAEAGHFAVVEQIKALQSVLGFKLLHIGLTM
jgi:hypothetical protein